MNIFEFKNYKQFTREKIESMPRNGRGQWMKMARHLRLHTSLVSQVFNGDKHLSTDQAYLSAEFLGLINLELQYYVCLVQRERAGNNGTKKLFDDQLEELLEKSRKISNRISKVKLLDESSKSIFYSNWFYSGVRLSTSIPSCNSLEAISEKLNLSKKLVSQVLEFLLLNSLVIEKNGKLDYGPLKTHIPADSPLVGRHHTNWRLKTIERASNLTEQELMFTCPVTISKEDFTKLKSLILEFIGNAEKVYSPSAPEILACLNIDLVKLTNDP